MRLLRNFVVYFTAVFWVVMILPAFPQTQLNLQAPAPNPVPSTSATIVGNNGNGIYYYWVIANYPTGGTFPTGPAVAQLAPSPLTGSNYVTISWAAATGATSYDVIKALTPAFPAPCSACKLATTSSLSTNDTGGALSSYTFSPTGPAQASIAINNIADVQPFLNVALFNNIANLNYRMGLVAGTTTTGHCAQFGVAGTIVDSGAVGCAGSGSGSVTSFNTRIGAVTLLTADVNSVGAITNNTSGNAATATALATTPTLCSAGNAPLGILVNGDATGCQAVVTSSAFSVITTGTNVSAAMLVGTGASLGFTGSGTIDANNVNSAIVPASATVIATNVSRQVIAATVQGNGTKVQLSTGTTTTNNCAKFDANGNVVDAGAACGTGNGTITSVFGNTGPAVGATGDINATGRVIGINSVPLCTGFTPTNGQNLQYTTGGTPNPCYTAASSVTGIAGGFSVMFLGANAAAGVTEYLTIPYGCTINNWVITGDSTATIKLWRVADGGTAIPTVANTISTSGFQLTTGTRIHSTNISDLSSTAISAYDTFGVNLFAYGGSTGHIEFTLGCTR